MANKLFKNSIPCLLAVLAAGCSGGGGGRGQKSLAVGAQAGPISIRSFSPSPDSRAVFGEQMMFQVTLDENADQTPEFSWKVDGVPSATKGSILFLATKAGDPAVRWVEVHISLGGPNSTSMLWKLQILDGPLANAPPAIVCTFPTGPLSLVAGEMVDLSIHADDQDSQDILSYRWSIDDQPSSPGEGILSLESAGLGTGGHSVRVYVKDDARMDDADAPSFAWNVEVQGASGNRPPVIVSAFPPCPVRISSGSSLAMSASVQDFEGDALTYRWEVDDVVQPETGDTFLFRSGAADVLQRTVRLTVTDSQGAQSPGGTFEWKVQVAQPPAPDLDSGTLTVVWNVVQEDVKGNAETVAGYRVYSALDSEPFELKVDVGLQTEATLLNLERGSLYWVSVTAYDRAGNESVLATPITLTVP